MFAIYHREPRDCEVRFLCYFFERIFVFPEECCKAFVGYFFLLVPLDGEVELYIHWSTFKGEAECLVCWEGACSVSPPIWREGGLYFSSRVFAFFVVSGVDSLWCERWRPLGVMWRWRTLGMSVGPRGST